MKIIIIDNYDRDTVDDILFKENVSKEEGELIVSEMNAMQPENSDKYYRLVSSEYKLYKCNYPY